MKKNGLIQSVFILLMLFNCLQSCTDENPEPLLPSTGFYNLYRIGDISGSKEPIERDLLNSVRGSVGKRGSGSKTILSRKNEFGLGLYLSANHVYNISGWDSRNPEFFNPNNSSLGIFESSQLPPTDGSVVFSNLLSSDFPFIHFEISPNATNTTILPEQDFYLGLIDSQKTEKRPFPQYPDKINTTRPLELFDPKNRTKADKTWAMVVPGEKVLGIGYPNDRQTFPDGAVASGKVFSDTEALTIVAKLKAEGDSEGDLPYNPEVEFFVDAQAISGMSGGGVFNSQGQLLGIMVRASDKNKAPKIIRVVKIDYILRKTTEYLNELTPSQQIIARSFLMADLNQTESK